ncbi:MAG: hypothetical protein DMG57_23780 [Acidobacteria bacterium]|nr:MAG: hypothetical protein DMG57_23780 [Acidobacteriota bacterium]
MGGLFRSSADLIPWPLTNIGSRQLYVGPGSTNVPRRPVQPIHHPNIRFVGDQKTVNAVF